MPKTRTHPARAFTLIELIAVITVMAILAVVSVPASLTLTTGRPAAASSKIQQDLLFARTRAMATGSSSWVTFSTSTNSYSVLADNTSTPGFASAATITDPASGSPMSIILTRDGFAGVTIVSANFGGTTTIGFDRLGRPLKTDGSVLASSGTLTLSGSKTITVTTPTGRISGN